jgi:heme/copper-type cytochrome/quinol oxidase subunit 2
MTPAKDFANSDPSRTFFGIKLILVIIIVSVVGVVFGILFFFISDTYNAFEGTNNFLLPNCYSISGNQICPTT